jgi:SPASM domain peptide maturase of grasp-with-spasm system
MKFPIDIPFHLFASCVPVKGVVRSVIYDLHRNHFEYIPNSLFDMLTDFKDITFSDLLEKIDTEEEKKILVNYFEFLLEKEFVFFSKFNSNFFPKYSADFCKPYNISCLVIDIDSNSIEELNRLKSEIINTKIECLVFRFFVADEFEIKRVISFFNDIPVRIIQLFVEDKIHIENSFFEDLIDLNSRLSVVLKYNAAKGAIQDLRNGVLVETERNVISTRMKINDISDFDINMDLFMESHLYNNFFNKRAYINSNGDIYRYENDNLTFGNINSTSLLDSLKTEKFKEYWNINKDQVFICKDCEYKYMCVDNREPLYKNDLDLWVLEGDCNYNPSIGKWNI